MSLVSGTDYIPNHVKTVIADPAQWRNHAYRNFDKVLKLILLFSIPDEPKCIFCGNQSLNYTSLGSLSNHYRQSHKHQCVTYYLENIIKIEPEKIKELYEKNGNVIMEMVI